MLALCSMLLGTYYAQNYAGIIGWALLNSNEVTKRYTRDCEAAMDDNSSTVDLVLSNILGAELSKPWEQHPMVSLRWWLLCRGISMPTTWKKAKLIERYWL